MSRNLKNNISSGRCSQFAALSASAQPAIQPTVDITKVPAAAQPSPQFDADAATEAYMAMMPPAAVARSERLLRRRLLAHPMGFPLRRGDLPRAAESPLVGPHARPAPCASRASAGCNLFCMESNTSSLPPCSAFRSSTTRTMCASTNTAWPRKPSGRGWATNSSRCWYRWSSPLSPWWFCSPSCAGSRRPGGFGARLHRWAC